MDALRPHWTATAGAVKISSHAERGSNNNVRTGNASPFPCFGFDPLQEPVVSLIQADERGLVSALIRMVLFGQPPVAPGYLPDGHGQQALQRYFENFTHVIPADLFLSRGRVVEPAPGDKVLQDLVQKGAGTKGMVVKHDGVADEIGVEKR